MINNPIIVNYLVVEDYLQLVSNKMRVVVIYHITHHNHLDRPQYETLGLVTI